MSETEHLFHDKEKKATRWFFRILKIAFILAAIILVMFTILGNMGGSNPTLKAAVENYATSLFYGGSAKVDNLIDMSFFPTVNVHFTDLNVYSGGAKGLPIVTIDEAQASMSFWNVATSTPKFKRFYVENLKALGGVYAPETLHVEKAYIDHDIEADIAFMRANGQVGVHAWSLSLGLDVYGRGGQYSYMLGRVIPIDGELGDITFSGTLNAEQNNHLKLRDFNVSSGDVSLTANMTMTALERQLLKIKGTLQTEDGRSIIKPNILADFTQTPTKFSGDITTEALHLDDVTGPEAMMTLLTRVREIFGMDTLAHALKEERSFIGAYDLDLDLNLGGVQLDDTQETHDFSLPVLQKNGHLKFGPVQENDKQVFPALFSVLREGHDDMVYILQDGQMDLTVLGYFINRPEQPGMDNVTVTCGQMMLQQKQDGSVRLDPFIVSLSDGYFTGQPNEAEQVPDLSDISLHYHTGQGDLERMTLPADAYDFIAPSLGSTTGKKPCAAYLEKQAASENAALDTQKAQ